MIKVYRELRNTNYKEICVYITGNNNTKRLNVLEDVYYYIEDEERLYCIYLDIYSIKKYNIDWVKDYRIEYKYLYDKQCLNVNELVLLTSKVNKLKAIGGWDCSRDIILICNLLNMAIYND